MVTTNSCTIASCVIHIYYATTDELLSWYWANLAIGLQRYEKSNTFLRVRDIY